MSINPPLRDWILEGLLAEGGSASVLALSRQVWARHRADLESAGDLVLTWQIDLRATAQDMAGEGTLVVDGDSWSLPVGATAAPAPHPSRWSPDDIDAAVEAYVSMLRAAADGRPVRRAEALAAVRETTGRSGTALDAMLSNISAVVQELGLEPLPAHPPRSNVPAGVRPAVRAALADYI